MRAIRLSSVLPSLFREGLEQLVFFNPEQELITSRLVDLVRRYGVPEIVDEDGRLRFRSQGLGMLQTLYALDATEEPQRLVGVAMFTRIRRRSLVVVHLAVHQDYTSRGQWRGETVVARLIDAIKTSALRTRGVKNLRVLYPHEIRFDLHAAP